MVCEAMQKKEKPVVVSVEQALSMSYATLRFVHLGWRVIRVEATQKGERPGDPNRYVGRPVAHGGRNSYFVAPNVGKEAVALNLKDPRGQRLLKDILAGLDADVFCTNTLPSRHRDLGIDASTLRGTRPELIWCCISALGLAHPNVPGYDPVLQAFSGYMDLTGESDGPPLLCGPPITDLRAGDEAFSQILLAMYERQSSGQGKTIDVSMAQAATSWLLTSLPMLDMGSPPSEVRRSGNQHRQFIPTNAYKTKDGFIYLAVGSDAQWERLTRSALFSSLAKTELSSNEGRRKQKDWLHERMGEIISSETTETVAQLLKNAGIPASPITSIEQVAELEAVADKLLRTTSPDGKVIRLPPPAVKTEWLDRQAQQLPFAPAYGEHTRAVLTEVGIEEQQIAALTAEGVVA